MIQYVEINEKEYPIFFSFRAVFAFMSRQQIDSLEEVEQEINLGFDQLLSLYEQAFKKGAKKDDEFDGEPLTAEQIEDAIDEDPKLFIKLQELFDESRVVNALAEESDDKKK